jgi:hypothetical protein
MGNESYIVDMRGFEAYHKTEEHKESNVSSSLWISFENGRDEIENIEDKEIQASVYKAFDEITQLDENIKCGISDQCMAQPP